MPSRNSARASTARSRTDGQQLGRGVTAYTRVAAVVADVVVVMVMVMVMVVPAAIVLKRSWQDDGSSSSSKESFGGVWWKTAKRGGLEPALGANRGNQAKPRKI
jgi:hypothetical protein